MERFSGEDPGVDLSEKIKGREREREEGREKWNLLWKKNKKK